MYVLLLLFIVVRLLKSIHGNITDITEIDYVFRL